jgi:hypothetical protein
MTITFPQPVTALCEHTNAQGNRCNEPVEQPLWLAQGWLPNGKKYLDYCPYHTAQYEREQERPEKGAS